MSEAKKPILLVMAAGMGSRYGGLKQIDPVGSRGEVILDFSLYDAMMAGFERAVFVIKEENEEVFREHLKNRAEKYFDIDIAFQKMEDIPRGYDVPGERKKPWGTAHAVYSARDYIDAPFCVINADDYYGSGAFLSMYDKLEEEADGYSMVAFKLGNTLTENGHVARGICEVSEDGILERVTERTMIERVSGVPAFSEDGGKTWENLTDDTPVSMNFWGLPASFMDAVEKRFPAFMEDKVAEDPEKAEFYLPEVVQALMNEEGARVSVLESRDKWYGVTYKKDREQVVNALESMKDAGLYPDELFK